MIVQLPSNRMKLRSGRRGNEVARDFDHYHRIACRLAKKQFISWFPTHEDLVQAAALATAEALTKLGEEAALKQLCHTLRPVLYRQAVAYGLRSTTNRKAGTHKRLRTEICLCQVILEEDELYQLEYHHRAIGVGEFTLMAAMQRCHPRYSSSNALRIYISLSLIWLVSFLLLAPGFSPLPMPLP